MRFRHLKPRDCLLLAMFLIMPVLAPQHALASGGPPNKPKPVKYVEHPPSACGEFVYNAATPGYGNVSFGLGQCVRKGDIYITFVAAQSDGKGGWTLSMLVSKDGNTYRQQYSVQVMSDPSGYPQGTIPAGGDFPDLGDRTVRFNANAMLVRVL